LVDSTGDKIISYRPRQTALDLARLGLGTRKSGILLANFFTKERANMEDEQRKKAVAG